MKSRLLLLLTLTLSSQILAEEVRFFRVTGPVASTVTAITADGFVTWSNAPTNATFTVQTAASLVGPSNWVDYIQLPVTNPVTTLRLYDPNPPSGMALIPAGSFTMGNSMATNEGSITELPVHTVYVSMFYVDRYEVTKALWDDVYQWATNHGYNFTKAGMGQAANHPVHTIRWSDTLKWCNARSQKEGLDACYYTDASQASVYMTGVLNLTNACVKWIANGYRLPTEAEWEKAARGGLKAKRFPWSDTISHSNANYYAQPGNPPYDISATSGVHPTYNTGGSSYPFTSPVGAFAANGYGLLGMSGNLLEWTWDGYDSTYYGQPAATQDNPRGPTVVPSNNRVLRGGHWGEDAFYARCAARDFGSVLDTAHYGIGFRCVRRL